VSVVSDSEVFVMFVAENGKNLARKILRRA
jgi:hypothetical protein